MPWKFVARVAAKRLLPGPVEYGFEVEEWSSGTLVELGIDASISLEIVTPAKAWDALYWDKPVGEHVLSPERSAEGVSFVRFWPDAESAPGNLFSVVIGLPEETLEALAPHFDSALVSGCRIVLFARGEFSLVENHPRGIPTGDEFRTGTARELSDIVIKVVGEPEVGRQPPA